MAIRRAERKQRVRSRRRQAPAKPVSMPAPYGGLNTRDAIDEMQPNDAVHMDNFFPDEGRVSIRPGKTSHSDTATGTAIESMFELNSSTANQLIACSGNEIYNVTTGTPATISDAGSPYSNNQWDGVNFNGVLPLVNGADAPRQWDGTTMTTPAWTGPTISTLSGVHAHKFRLYFWTGDDQSFWYAAPNAILGALTKFDLSRVTGLGGKLINVESWTVDGGSGPDDYIVFIFDSGAVVMYQGSDPGDATDWAITGIYEISEPVGGNRCATKVGTDLMVTTTADVISLTQVLRNGYVGTRTKITGALKNAAALHKATYGWQSFLHPEGHMLIINQPDYNSNFKQLVMNTITGAWCRFVDINPVCWSRYAGDAYCGGQDGIVYKLEGTIDVATAIDASAIQAWSDLGIPYDKHITLMRPIISAEGSISYNMAIGVDFKEILATTPSSSTSTGSPWDVSAWDVSPWSPENLVFTDWRAAAAKGQFIAANLKISATQAISWLKTDYRAKIVGNL